MKRMRVFLAISISLILISTLFVSCKPGKKGTSLIMGTATTGGTFYPVGVAIATLTTQKLGSVDHINMTAISTAGSGENVKLLQKKEAQLGILQSLFGSMAWQGRGKYEGKKVTILRSMTMLWENVEHFTVLSKYAKTGNISDLNNVKGEKFSIGKKGSGTETSGRTILGELGFNVDKDYSLEFLGYGPSASAMQDGRIQAMNIPAGVPATAITQAFATIGADKIQVLQFTDEQIKKVNATYPVWNRFVIKANTYPGQKEDINTIAQPNFLAVHKDLPDEVVYKILKTIYANLPFLNEKHKATKAMKLERAILGLSVPLHPGAVKFYTEQGIKIPDSLMPPK